MIKRETLTAGISASAMAVAMTAFTPSVANAQSGQVIAAQVEETDADGNVVEEDTVIIVSGFRDAIQNSINTKRKQDVIAEAFSAEDIGKLPDVSIAETLGRLPGLATQRLDGRSQVLSIRGLGPDYSTSLLNGRELVSSGDNRAVEYDQYPSELIDSGVVFKTPYAGLIGQGLAGTVDLHTIRPLSKGERIVAISGRLEFNEDGSLNPDVKGWGYRATATYVDQFADDTLGLALGVAYQSSPSQVKKFNAWGYPEENGQLVLGGMKPFAKSVDLDRLGVFGTLEWEPSEEWSNSLDVFYADYRERIPQRGIEFPLYPGWGAGTQITNLSSGAFPDSATFTGVQPVVRNDYDRKDTTTLALGWNTKYETDDVILDLDVSYSKSKRRLQQIESYSGLSYAANAAAPSDTVTYTRNPDGFPFLFTNQIDYANTSLIQLTDPRGWGGDLVQAGFINDTSTKDDLFTVRGEVIGKVESPLIKHVVAGAAYSKRSKSRNITQNFLSLAGGPSVYNSQGAVTRAPIPSDALLDSIDSLGFLGFGNQVAYDPFALINNGTYILTDVQSSSLPYPGDWTVDEKVFTGYLRADIDGDMGSVPVTGNFGVQMVFTDQSSDGFQSNGGIGAVQVPVSGGANYANLMPSINLNFEFTPELIFRVGAARTLARPRMDQLNASYNASIANQPPIDGFNSIFSGGGGNPRLLPYLADGVDGSLEYYFGNGTGYVSTATYYKKLKQFVNPNAPVLRDFSELVPLLTPTQQAAFVATGNQTLGLASAPDNGAEGYIFGIEGTLSLPFGVFSSGLDGFGIQTSASYTKSKLDVTLSDGQTFNVDTPGLSKWVVNSTAYFEKSGFEARVSHRYRSSYLAEFIGISASRSFRRTYSESIFDAQIGYRFQDGSSLEGLSLTLQALNLTNEPFQNYTNDDTAQIIDYEEYGRTYLVGVSYRF